MKLCQGLLRISSVLTVVALAACSGPEQKIVGKWQAETNTEEYVLDFYPDGTIAMNLGGDYKNGEYQFLDEDTIKIEQKGIGASLVGPIIFDVEFPSDDRLELTRGKTTDSLERIE